MTLYMTNLIHDEESRELSPSHQAAVVRGWMLRNYSNHLLPNGFVDAEALAEQAAFEWCVDRQLADDPAAIVAQEVDN